MLYLIRINRSDLQRACGVTGFRLTSWRYGPSRTLLLTVAAHSTLTKDFRFRFLTPMYLLIFCALACYLFRVFFLPPGFPINSIFIMLVFHCHWVSKLSQPSRHQFPGQVVVDLSLVLVVCSLSSCCFMGPTVIRVFLSLVVIMFISFTPGR